MQHNVMATLAHCAAHREGDSRPVLVNLKEFRLESKRKLLVHVSLSYAMIWTGDIAIMLDIARPLQVVRGTIRL